MRKMRPQFLIHFCKPQNTCMHTHTHAHTEGFYCHSLVQVICWHYCYMFSCSLHNLSYFVHVFIYFLSLLLATRMQHTHSYIHEFHFQIGTKVKTQSLNIGITSVKKYRNYCRPFPLEAVTDARTHKAKNHNKKQKHTHTNKDKQRSK